MSVVFTLVTGKYFSVWYILSIIAAQTRSPGAWIGVGLWTPNPTVSLSFVVILLSRRSILFEEWHWVQVVIASVHRVKSCQLIVRDRWVNLGCISMWTTSVETLLFVRHLHEKTPRMISSLTWVCVCWVGYALNSMNGSAIRKLGKNRLKASLAWLYLPTRSYIRRIWILTNKVKACRGASFFWLLVRLHEQIPLLPHSLKAEKTRRRISSILEHDTTAIGYDINKLSCFIHQPGVRSVSANTFRSASLVCYSIVIADILLIAWYGNCVQRKRAGNRGRDWEEKWWIDLLRFNVFANHWSKQMTLVHVMSSLHQAQIRSTTNTLRRKQTNGRTGEV